MKPQVKAYLIAALTAVAMLAGCATGPSEQAVQTSAANRILEAYDVPDLLVQAGPAVNESLDKNLPDDVTDADRARLRAIVDDAYSPEALQAHVIAQLKQSAQTSGHQKSLADAADELDSALAQRMIDLESATGDPDFAQQFDAFAEQPTTDARQRRLRVIDALADNMQVEQLQTAFNIALLETMIRSRNAAVDNGKQVDEQQIDRILSNTRDGISSKLDERVPLMLLYVYRSVDDDTLDQYAQLQSQPDMIWTNQALSQSIIDALTTAGKKVPARFNADS